MYLRTKVAWPNRGEKKYNSLYLSLKFVVYHCEVVFINTEMHIWKSVGTPHEPVLDHCLQMMSAESVLLKLSFQGRCKNSGLGNRISMLMSQDFGVDS